VVTDVTSRAPSATNSRRGPPSGTERWTFGYNRVMIPLAAFGLAHPILAAAAIALSAVDVVSDSPPLRRLGPAPGRRRTAPVTG
jgi:hypothetical protein